MAKVAPTHTDTAADVLAIFGISGDLAKKMTFRALYRLEARGKLDCPIVGVAIDEWDDEQLRRHAHDSIQATVSKPDEEIFKRLAARLSYVQGDYADAATFERVGKALGDAKSPVFYLEVPPSLFGTVVDGLGRAGLTENAHVVIEKPFGHDLESARALNAELCAVLTEDQILRIDHYLGKEPVMDITYLRFVNSILEPVWNRSHVSHVQMTIAENFGVDDRGRFYDEVGAMRDVIQNHALQVLALYPANSIFTQGYLTTGGATVESDHQMIKDAGFELELASGEAVPADPVAMKGLKRPSLLPLASS